MIDPDDLRLVLFTARQSLLDQRKEYAETYARCLDQKNPLYLDIINVLKMRKQQLREQARAYARLLFEATEQWPSIPWPPILEGGP